MVVPAKRRVNITASAQIINNWKAELIDEPSTMTDSLLPALMFRIRLNNMLAQQRPIHHIDGEVYIGKEIGNNIVEMLYLDELKIRAAVPAMVRPNSYIDLTAYIALPGHVIEAIEDVRNGKDVFFSVDLRVWSAQNVSIVPVSYLGRRVIRIAKSTWAERILRELRYARITAVELPAPISIPELRNALSYLDYAWHSLHIGEYADAVINVRRSLDALIEGLQQIDPNLIEEQRENNRVAFKGNRNIKEYSRNYCE